MRTAFLHLNLMFAHFWHKKIGVKAAHKMLVKLTLDTHDITLALADYQREHVGAQYFHFV
jgi:hypothetical protein